MHHNPFHNHNPLSISTDTVSIPLLLGGTTIFMDTTTPTQCKLDTSPHIHLTLDTEWNPHTVRLVSTQSAEAEPGFGDTEPGLLQILSVYCLHEMAESTSDQRIISAVDVEARKTFISIERHPAISSEQLSKRWNIGLKHARQTLKVITQRVVRSAKLPLS